MVAFLFLFHPGSRRLLVQIWEDVGLKETLLEDPKKIVSCFASSSQILGFDQM